MPKVISACRRWRGGGPAQQGRRDAHIKKATLRWLWLWLSQFLCVTHQLPSNRLPVVWRHGVIYCDWCSSRRGVLGFPDPTFRALFARFCGSSNWLFRHFFPSRRSEIAAQYKLGRFRNFKMFVAFVTNNACKPIHQQAEEVPITQPAQRVQVADPGTPTGALSVA